MAKIKEVSSYNGTSWDTPVPIGANDANIDITSSTTNPTDTTATSAGLVDSNVTVASGDTAASAWTKFNRFRKRVQNAFGDFAGVTLRTAYNTSNTSTSVYTTGVINNYMSNVIGYTGTTEPSAGTVAAQLSSLNTNLKGSLNVISPLEYGAKYDGVTDCTTAIQMAINNASGKTVKFSGNGTALIRQPIVLKEDTHILLDKGFTLKIADASNCPMFKNTPSDLNYNDSQAGQNIQNNISIVGGILDFNGNNQTWQNSNFRTNVGIILCDVNNLLIKDTQLIDPITFGIFLNGISNFTIENIFCNFSNQHNNMDGIHLGGKCEYGTIDNIYGTSNDDFIALNSGDVTDRNALLRIGATHDIVVKNIKCYNGYRAVRLLAGNNNHSELYNISIENIAGSFRYGAVLISTYSTTTRAYYRNISIKNVLCDCLTNCDLITFQGNYTASSTILAESVTIENVMFRQKTSKLANIITISTQTTIENLIVNDVLVNCEDIDLSSRHLIAGTGTVYKLILSNIDLRKPTTHDGMQSVATTISKTVIEVNNFIQNGEIVGYLPGEHIPIDGQWSTMTNSVGNLFGVLVQTPKYIPDKTLTTSNAPRWLRANGQHFENNGRFTFNKIERVNDYMMNIVFDSSVTVPITTASICLFDTGAYVTF